MKPRTDFTRDYCRHCHKRRYRDKMFFIPSIYNNGTPDVPYCNSRACLKEAMKEIKSLLKEAQVIITSCNKTSKAIIKRLEPTGSFF